MQPTVVLNVVGLAGDLLGAHTPRLSAFAKAGAGVPLHTITPAVTCSVQSTFLTGTMPSQHGIVGNGWYFRDLAQPMFWRQSNALVQGEKVWETARSRAPELVTAKLFWWYNMYASVQYSITPRPMYPADGRKVLDTYSEPPELNERIKAELGPFPFINFWGPASGIQSSRWIAAASRCVFDWHRPGLLLVYLPHLDYSLQKVGPGHPSIAGELAAIDTVCGELIDHCQAQGARVIVLSEYGITPVSGPVHINRVLREAGHIRVRPELGLEMLDPGASTAFAVADHQVAHVYVRDPAQVGAVKALLEGVPGIERVLDDDGKRELGLAHERSGELVAIAAAERWFTYYYWLDDAVAPDFARTVDIHRKPGFDPVELFVDPRIRFPPAKVAWILAKKALGFRYLMNVIPLDATLVKGSHGRVTDDPRHGPVFLTDTPALLQRDAVQATDVRDLILRHLFE